MEYYTTAPRPVSSGREGGMVVVPRVSIRISDSACERFGGLGGSKEMSGAHARGNGKTDVCVYVYVYVCVRVDV